MIETEITSLEEGIKQILHNVPYMNTYAEFKDAKDKENKEPRSYVVENKQQKILIYDKTLETKNKNGKKKKNDKENLLLVDENGEIFNGSILRIEIKLKNTNKIKSVLGTASIFKLRQDAMLSKLLDYMNKYLFNSYEKAKQSRMTILKSIVRKYKNMNNSGKQWVETMISEILIEEKSKGVHILLGKDELLETIKVVFHEDRNKARKYNNVEKVLNKSPYSRIQNEQQDIIDKLFREIKDQFSSLTN